LFTNALHAFSHYFYSLKVRDYKVVEMEINMESRVEKGSDSESLKKKVHFKIKENNLTDLRKLGRKLKTIQR